MPIFLCCRRHASLHATLLAELMDDYCYKRVTIDDNYYEAQLLSHHLQATDRRHTFSSLIPGLYHIDIARYLGYNRLLL